MASAVVALALIAVFTIPKVRPIPGVSRTAPTSQNADAPSSREHSKAPTSADQTDRVDPLRSVRAQQLPEGGGIAHQSIEYAFANVADLMRRADAGDVGARQLLAKATLECSFGNRVSGCDGFLDASSLDRAFPWIEHAARTGLEIAQLRYLDAAAGLLRDVDHPDFLTRKHAVATQGTTFLRSAAAKGNAEAMLRLGMMYGNGKFIPYDPANAYLFSLAGAWKIAGNGGFTASELEAKRPDLLRYRREVPASMLPQIQHQAREMSLCCG